MKKILFLALALTGCVTGANINFSDYNAYTSDKVGNKEYEDLGPVSASIMGSMSEPCDQVADRAMRTLLDQAKSMGGNVIYNVRFHDHGSYYTSRQAICKNLLGFPKVDVQGMAGKIAL